MSEFSVRLERRDDLEWAQLHAVQIEDDKRWLLLTDLRDDHVGGSFEVDVHAQRLCGRRDLDRENQVVNHAENHAIGL